MEVLKARMSFANCLAVDSIGRDGGLALLWMNTFSLEELSFSNQHIDMEDWLFNPLTPKLLLK